jgi:biopolymer transport protein ExbD
MIFQVKRRRPRIEIVPMIDVIFFMLIFFFLFSTLKTNQSGVEVNLPKTVNIGKSQLNTVVISITKEKKIYFNKELIGLAELERKAAEELRQNPGSRFVVKPDAKVAYVELIKVMDALAGVGVEQPLLGVDRRQIPKPTRDKQMERTGDDSI